MRTGGCMAQQQRNQLLWMLAAILVLGIIVAAIISYAVYGTVLPISQTCSIGVSGTAANVTFEGINANAFCDMEVQSSNEAYLMTGTPVGAEICEGDLQWQNHSIHYIVRDTGLFNLVGYALCKSLSNPRSS